MDEDVQLKYWPLRYLGLALSYRIYSLKVIFCECAAAGVFNI